MGSTTNVADFALCGEGILGVYSYMNTPDVTKRLQESIMNVKIEFSNFKAITGEDVKNINGKPIDLPALRVEFMSAQLELFTEDGTKYIKDQVDSAMPKYKACLQDLRQAEKR
ncbi:hypothetical protein BU25DRAFT_462839 [Macroventuria anomochaeta]|uniref:Uncharacterized protein n=1 Tax=Macroventuria anomochaeta TaxID=301207 RepID=A0ACB6RL38_9PLEO|nr:uncharacterized protein BU25DRAFT_462839 [Macroventuria anomochaeta]KAF2622518.1 hypothetical protein BU25DRAFT_462839 [Macroventuria anomochaeta]